MEACYIALDKRNQRADTQSAVAEELLDSMIDEIEIDCADTLENEINAVSNALYDIEICWDFSDVLEAFEPLYEKVKTFKKELQND